MQHFSETFFILRRIERDMPNMYIGLNVKYPLFLLRFPDGVIEIFHLHNPPGRTMALGLTQRLTEMSTGNISWE